MMVIRSILVVTLCLGCVGHVLAQEARWKELNEQALKLRSQGKYAEGTELAARSLAIAEKTFDPSHPNLAIALNNLASLYQAQGKYSEAEPLFKRSLAIREKARGTNDPAVAPALNNLALLYQAQGKYSEAEPLFKRSLGICEKAEGPNHPNVARVLSNLADLYRAQANYFEAEPLNKRSLAILEKALGPNDPAVTAALNNLALLHQAQGKYSEAEPLYKRSLAIREKTLGHNHPDVAVVLAGLANLYRDQGEYSEAEPLFKRSLTIVEKSFGPDHPNVGVVLNGLARLHQTQGKYSEAEPLFKRSLAIREKALGLGHSHVSQSLNNLALLYFFQGKYSEAEPLYKRSLAISEKALGPDHPDVGAPLNNLAKLYRFQGQYAEAEPLYKQSLAIVEKALGADHPSVALVLSNLGDLYSERGDQEAALELFQRSLAIYVKKDLPDARKSKNMIADLYLDTGDFSRAEPIVKEAGSDETRGRFSLLKSKYEDAKGHFENLLKEAEKSGDANKIFTAYSGLGMAYEGLEDHRKAEEYYEKGMKFTEELRSMVPPAERKEFFQVRINGFSRSEPAKGLTRVRMKINQAAESIDSSEQTRARAFSDSIAQRSQEGVAGVPGDTLKKEDELVTRVVVLKKERAKVEKDKNPERYDNISKEVDKAESELNKLIAMLREKYPAYAAVKYPQPVTLKQSSVRPEEYVVMFDVSSEGVGVKLIKGKEILETAYKRWKLEDLEKDIRRFREPFELVAAEKMAALKKFDPELGESLYKNLLARVLLDVPKGTHLTIIPDGVLAVLPFEALVVGGKANWRDGAKGAYPEGLTYLGDVYPISYYQSINSLTLVRTVRGREKPGNRVLVIADPVFHMQDVRAQGAKETRLASEQGRTFPDLMASIEGASEGSFKFSRLAKTKALGEGLQKLYGNQMELCADLKANKEYFLKTIGPRLSQYGSIVFATHGLFSTKIPGIREPFLALTMVPPGTDGFLTMSDVMSLKMNADVVALTACQTGLGKDLSGEGVMSMGRAFQYAGARSVLMSLWSVAEDSSVILTESFFRNIKAGKSKLEALKLAREEVRKAGYEHPFFWTPFILVGEVN